MSMICSVAVFAATNSEPNCIILGSDGIRVGPSESVHMSLPRSHSEP